MPNVLRLKAVTAVDPGALICVLQLFRGRNVVPQQVRAQRITVRGTAVEVLQIEIEIASVQISADAMRLIVTKIQQMPIVMSAAFDRSP